MLFGFWITILLGHAKVNHENKIGCVGSWPPDQKVIWFDISVYQVVFVQRFYPIQLKFKKGVSIQ
jgi:hypothetical protein